MHSPTPHLHPSNSPSCSSICAMHQDHIPTGQKRIRHESSPSLTALLPFFLSCAETFLLISQPLPCQHRIGSCLREHWLLSCYTYLPQKRIRAPGAQQGCSYRSTQPFLEQAHTSTAHFCPDQSEMHQPAAAISTWTGMLLFRVTFFPHQVPVL